MVVSNPSFVWKSLTREQLVFDAIHLKLNYLNKGGIYVAGGCISLTGYAAWVSSSYIEKCVSHTKQ